MKEWLNMSANDTTFYAIGKAILFVYGMEIQSALHKGIQNVNSTESATLA